MRVPDGESLTCIMPSDGDFWPFGGQPQVVVPGEAGAPGSGGGSDTGKKVGLGVGIPLGIIAAAVLAWAVRKWYLGRTPAAPPTGMSYAARYAASSGGVAATRGAGPGAEGAGTEMRTTPYPFGAGVGSESALSH